MFFKKRKSKFEKIKRWLNAKVLNLFKKKKPKFFLKPKTRNLIFGTFLILVLFISSFYLFFRPKQATAEWWDTNWHYRKAIEITNSVSTQTDFQVKVLENFDMSADVTAGKVQSNFNDLRFTDVNGKMLDYWIEDDTATSLDVWARLSFIPAGTSTVYMYYGNLGTSDRTITIGTSSFPGLSCKAILDAGNSSGDGVYWIDPSNGDFSDKEQVYCDMTNNDGGWMLVTSDMIESVYTAYMVTSTSTDPHGGIRYNFVSTERGCGNGMDPRATVKISNDYQWDQVRSKKILGPNGLASCWGVDGASYTVQTNLYKYNASEGDVIQDCHLTCEVSQFDIPPNVSHCDTDTDNFGRYNGDETRYFTQTSRRVGRGTVSGPGVGLDCQGIGLDWSIENIFIRENSLLYPNLTSTINSEERGPAPVGYWSFNEGYGTTAQDRTSNNNDGTIIGATWKNEEDCIAGNCLWFDDASDRVTVSSTIIPDLSEITVSMWVKIGPAPASNYPIFFNASGQYLYLAYHHDTDRFRVSWKDSGSNQRHISAYDFGNNSWHYITVTLANSSQKLYIDGILEGEASYTGLNSSSLTGANIGYYNTSYQFLGYLDEVKIYPYARTADQIKADYAARGTSKGTVASLGGGPSTGSGQSLSNGLVGYWKMDESNWNGTSGEVVDSSGNANHGTGQNSVSTTFTAKFGMAGSFDGSNDYIDLTNSNFSNTFTDSDDFSISAWVKLDSLPSQYTTVVGQRFGDNMVFGVNPSGKLYLNMDDTRTGSPKSDTSLTVDSWYHVVATYTGSDNSHMANFYIDGQFDNRGESYDGNGSGSSAELSIGCQSRSDIGADSYFYGEIDEVRVYNRALSSREVRQLYEYAPGPVGHWKMDEKSGDYAYDVSGNGNVGTLINGPTWTNGKYGSTLSFDGGDDYVSVLNSTILKPEKITVEAWVKMTDDTARRQLFLTKWNGYSCETDTSHRPFFRITNGGDSPRGDALAMDEWYHFAGVYDPSTEAIHQGNSLYINGQYVGTTANSNSITHSDSILTIGKYTGGYNWGGEIDEVKIYNYARTQKQILEDMNAGRPAQKLPIAHWKFDEGTNGTCLGKCSDDSTKSCRVDDDCEDLATCEGEGKDVCDASGYGNDGTISGATWTNADKIGKALDFNGSSDQITINNDSGFQLDSASDSFTLSTWINIDAASAANAFILGKNSAYGLSMGTNLKPHMYFGSGSTDLIANATINTGTWYHIVGVFNISEAKIYINGVLDKFGSISGVASQGNNLTVGGIGVANYYFNGLIDDIKIWNYALTEDEIKAEYNQGRVGVMGSFGGDGGGSTSSASTAEYCVPGSSDVCDPPIAEWNFEEHSGSTTYDTSGNGNTGTLTSMEESDWVPPGKIGGALEFDGLNRRVLVPANTDFDFVGDYTLEAWIKPDDVSEYRHGIMGKLSSNGWGLNLEYDKANFGSHTCSNFEGTTSLEVGAWYHIVGIYKESGSEEIYVNGQLDSTGSLSDGNCNNDTSDVVIGWYRTSTTEGFDGKIDQVRIYNYARTPAQVAWDYNKGKPIAHYRMDKGEGTTIYDSSGNENHGTLNLGSSGQTSAGSVKVSSNTAWYNGRNGKLNYSLNFDGSDDYVEGGGAQIDGGQFTINVWANPTATGDRQLFGVGSEQTTNKAIFTRFNSSTSYRWGFWGDYIDGTFENILNRWNICLQ
ncbi:DUF2341 domain-containing protein [Patescibacteria group bacterium]|nr:DUF2341 domain-containing protein [Patescibacteria group bacterium]